MSPDQQNPGVNQPQGQSVPNAPAPQQPASLQPGEAFLIRPAVDQVPPATDNPQSFQSQPPVSTSQASQPAQPGSMSEPMIPYNPNPTVPQPATQFAMPPLQPLQVNQSQPASPHPVATPYQPIQTQVTQPVAPSYPQPQAASNFQAQPANDQTTSPYDFFLNEPKKAKKPLLPLPPKPSNRFNTIMYVAGGAIVLVILLSIIFGIANRNKGKNPDLTALTATQQYIIHTSDSASTSLQSSDLTGFAVTARDTTTTAQQQLLTYLSQHGIRVNQKALGTLTDSQTDNALTAAKSAGTYDATYAQVMQRLLQQYSQGIETARRTAAGPNEIKLLSQEQDSVKLLQTMLSSTGAQSNQ